MSEMQAGDRVTNPKYCQQPASPLGKRRRDLTPGSDDILKVSPPFKRIHEEQKIPTSTLQQALASVRRIQASAAAFPSRAPAPSSIALSSTYRKQAGSSNLGKRGQDQVSDLFEDPSSFAFGLGPPPPTRRHYDNAAVSSTVAVQGLPQSRNLVSAEPPYPVQNKQTQSNSPAHDNSPFPYSSQRPVEQRAAGTLSCGSLAPPSKVPNQSSGVSPQQRINPVSPGQALQYPAVKVPHQGYPASLNQLPSQRLENSKSIAPSKRVSFRHPGHGAQSKDPITTPSQVFSQNLDIESWIAGTRIASYDEQRVPFKTHSRGTRQQALRSPYVPQRTMPPPSFPIPGSNDRVEQQARNTPHARPHSQIPPNIRPQSYVPSLPRQEFYGSPRASNRVPEQPQKGANWQQLDLSIIQQAAASREPQAPSLRIDAPDHCTDPTSNLTHWATTAGLLDEDATHVRGQIPSIKAHSPRMPGQEALLRASDIYEPAEKRDWTSAFGDEVIAGERMHRPKLQREIFSGRQHSSTASNLESSQLQRNGNIASAMQVSRSTLGHGTIESPIVVDDAEPGRPSEILEEFVTAAQPVSKSHVGGSTENCAVESVSSSDALSEASDVPVPLADAVSKPDGSDSTEHGTAEAVLKSWDEDKPYDDENIDNWLAQQLGPDDTQETSEAQPSRTIDLLAMPDPYNVPEPKYTSYRDRRPVTEQDRRRIAEAVKHTMQDYRNKKGPPFNEWEKEKYSARQYNTSIESYGFQVSRIQKQWYDHKVQTAAIANAKTKRKSKKVRRVERTVEQLYEVEGPWETGFDDWTATNAPSNESGEQWTWGPLT